MSTLQIMDLSHSYMGNSKLVLNHINVTFESGKTYSIMGKSGAGKTTFLSLLAGLEEYTSGDILYNQTSISNIDKDEYRAKSIGVIFQGYNLLLNDTALENIMLSMNISGVKTADNKKFALDLLAKVGIDNETAHRKVLKLSGGEQQRVAIARALSHSPDIIIADEPTGNLDEETEQDIMEIFTLLAKEENRCVIIVTHSADVASYTDELWGLNRGKLVFVK